MRLLEKQLQFPELWERHANDVTGRKDIKNGIREHAPHRFEYFHL